LRITCHVVDDRGGVRDVRRLGQSERPLDLVRSRQQRSNLKPPYIRSWYFEGIFEGCFCVALDNFCSSIAAKSSGKDLTLSLTSQRTPLRPPYNRAFRQGRELASPPQTKSEAQDRGKSRSYYGKCRSQRLHHHLSSDLFRTGVWVSPTIDFYDSQSSEHQRGTSSDKYRETVSYINLKRATSN
jgi:hypothetical protein